MRISLDGGIKSAWIAQAMGILALLFLLGIEDTRWPFAFYMVTIATAVVMAATSAFALGIRLVERHQLQPINLVRSQLKSAIKASIERQVEHQRVK